MYICRRCLDPLLPPRARRVELLLIWRVFWKIEKSKWGQVFTESECCCPRQSSWVRSVLCCRKSLGTSGRKHIPTPSEDLSRGVSEGAVSHQPGVYPGDALDQGLVTPSSSDTCLLCNLGHITHAHGDTTNIRAAEPSQQPGLGRVDNPRQIRL